MLRRRDRARGDLGVHVVGDVGGGAAGARGWRCCAAPRAGPCAGTIVGRQALRGQAARWRCRRAGSCVSEVAWPSPRRGSALTASTSSRTVCTPSPITCGGSRRAAATSGRRPPAGGSRRRAGTSRPSPRRLGRGRDRPARAARASMMLTVTPLPWLPSCGLTTTGRPISLRGRPGVVGVCRPAGPAAPARRPRAAAAWSGPCPARSTRRRRWCVSTSAAWMRRCLEPQPNCTRLPSVRRRYGMPRATAALTMEPVLGPRRIVFVELAQLAATAASRRTRCRSAAAAISALRQFERQAADLSPRCTRPRPGRRRARPCAVVRLKVTGQPACACSASAAVSSTCASGSGPSCRSGAARRSSGSSARSRGSKPAAGVDRAFLVAAAHDRLDARCGGSTGWGRAGRGCG